MKKSIIILFSCMFFLNSFAITDKFRLGISAAPGVSWAKPAGKDLRKGNVGYSMTYGLNLEYWFAENYGLATGLFGAMEGCNIKGRDYFELNDSTGTAMRSVNERYIFHSVMLPLTLKLRTNDINKFRAYGQIGFENYFTVSARATYDNTIQTSNGTEVVIEKENILRKANEVTKVIPKFRAGFYDIRLSVGGGFEYGFSEKVALSVGLYYHNGFLNMINDKSVDIKREPVLMRSVNLQIGLLF